MPSRSSRERFRQYRREVREREFDPSSNGSPHASPRHPHGDRAKHRRSRGFFQLLREFWGLIRPHRATLYVALATLSVSTLLGLAPLYGTKIVFDNILGDHPLPRRLTRLVALPADRGQLLGIVAVAMVALAAGCELVSLWSRWNLTRATQLVRVSVRKQVFDHAVRLPLHRVYDLKSGGVASILREDAGAVADLIFSLLYNPWRAIIQLLGSVAVLAFVDWRLLLGSLVLPPIVWITHRTWIGRIRPLMRDIRNTRQNIDAPHHRGLRRDAYRPLVRAAAARVGHVHARRQLHEPAGSPDVVVDAGDRRVVVDPHSRCHGHAALFRRP